MSGRLRLIVVASLVAMVALGACSDDEPSAEPVDDRLPTSQTVITTPGEARHADCVDSQTRIGVERAYSGVYCSCVLGEVDRLEVDAIDDLPTEVLAGCQEISLDAGDGDGPDPTVGGSTPSPTLDGPYIPVPPVIGGGGNPPRDS